jgi:hypothetical protein
MKQMFENHSFTKDKYKIDLFYNYENLHKTQLDEDHVNLLRNCDIFIYQPFNKDYIDSEYDITNIKKYLNENVTILKINYYRFKGFWYNSECKPYHNFRNYLFLDSKCYGLHDSFRNFTTTSKSKVIDKINNILIPRYEILSFFDNELNKLKIIDDNSDINMLDYFMNNYKTKHLFHDPFHPTNLFFYEIFRQIIAKLDNYELEYEDYNFVNSLSFELTHWALPILPIIKKHLELKLDDIIPVFSTPEYGGKKQYMNVYDYYYIRLSQENFENYLNSQSS